MATEHEDQAYCSWHNHCAHSHHHPVGVPWLQVQQVRAYFFRSIASVALPYNTAYFWQKEDWFLFC